MRDTMKTCKCGLNPNSEQSKAQRKWETDHVKRHGVCSSCAAEAAEKAVRYA